MSNENHRSVGGELERSGGGWSARDDNWDQRKDAAPAAPAPDAGKEADAGGGEQLFDGFDEGQIANFRDLLARHVMTTEELGRAHGLNAQELAALEGEAPAAKPVPRQSIEKQLADIAAMRRERPREYWGDEAIQQRERELLAARVTAKAEAPTASAEPAATTTGADKRLAEIREMQRSDPARYWSASVQQEELALLQTRDAAKEGATHDAAIQGFLDTLRAGMEDTASMESGFDQLFPTLPSEDQDRIRQEVAFPTEPVRPASEKEIAAFAERPEGRELIDEWGRAAPRKVAAFQTRLKAMVKADTTGKLASWFAARTSAEAAAIARALAR